MGCLWREDHLRLGSGQIDQVKECAKKLKEAEIDHSKLTSAEKENQKQQWKQWIDSTAKGFKDKLKEMGRME